MRDEYKNVALIGLWQTAAGHYRSMPLDEKALASLQKVIQTGGRLFVRNRTEEAIAKSPDPTKTPTAYLEFISAEADADFRSRSSKRQEPASIQADPI